MHSFQVGRRNVSVFSRSHDSSSKIQVCARTGHWRISAARATADCCTRRSVRAHVFSKLFGSWSGGRAPKPNGSENADVDEEPFSTMRRLDEDDETGVDGSEQAFGPGAVLLIGFLEEEVQRFREIMQSMEADMFRIIPATRAMMDGTLEAALEADRPAYELPVLGTRRAVVLSGMYGGEVIEVVSAYRESDMPPAVFAAAVPNNMGRQVRELITEVIAEDQAMRRIDAERSATQQEGEKEQ